MITPWGMYMNPRRTGGLYALSFAVSAHPIDSMRGRASETPSPFRQVRRSILELLVIDLLLAPHSAMCKGITRHDALDERLHAVPVIGDLMYQVIHHNFVIAFQS